MVTTFITFGLIIAVFYFLIIRPQRKREKETKAMINAVKKGDKVVTIGGIRGTVTSVKDAVITLKVDDNTKIEFSKSAISSVIDKKAESEKAPAPEKVPEKTPDKAPAKAPAKKAPAKRNGKAKTEKPAEPAGSAEAAAESDITESTEKTEKKEE